MEIFFAKSKEDKLAPRVLCDEENFYEGSFDEEFLSEDNERLERYRMLEERVSSRLQVAVHQDDTASIVSLEGVSKIDLPDYESDSHAEIDRSIPAKQFTTRQPRLEADSTFKK